METKPVIPINDATGTIPFAKVGINIAIDAKTPKNIEPPKTNRPKGCLIEPVTES